MEITNRLSAFLAELRYEDLSTQVIEQVKLFIADYYAACFAGCRINRGLNEKALQLLKAQGGREEADVLFSDIKLPAGNAAFVNALYAHGADMDDGNRKAAGHVATHVMPAVFALAQAEGSSWKDVITAIVAGYEAFNRVAGAAQPSLYNKGFHSTGVGGALACAAACAKLLGLDQEGIYNAISLGALQSSGLIIIDESGQGCKPINPANAARTGLFSAQLAQLGIDAPRNPLESKKGWFNAFSEGINEKVLFEDLGQVYTICESYLKLYPSCRHTHCGIDAALALREEMGWDGLGLGDVEEIRVVIYPSAIKSTGSIRYPKTPDEAKFSLCYCISTALTRGGFGLDELDTEHTGDCLGLVDKIVLIEDATMEDRAAGKRGCRLEITAKNGSVYARTVEIPKGEAKLPLGWQDVEVKLSACAGDLCGRKRQAEILRQLQTLDPEAAYTALRV